jgi:hypothetical protein
MVFVCVAEPAAVARVRAEEIPAGRAQPLPHVEPREGRNQDVPVAGAARKRQWPLPQQRSRHHVKPPPYFFYVAYIIHNFKFALSCKLLTKTHDPTDLPKVLLL